ncbi:MAG: hypothetical protein WDM79_13180 [Terricaulis sp.]
MAASRFSVGAERDGALGRPASIAASASVNSVAALPKKRRAAASTP